MFMTIPYIQGRRTRGGPAPLELGIYIVKVLKIGKISFFLLFGPPRQNLFRRPWLYPFHLAAISNNQELFEHMISLVEDPFEQSQNDDNDTAINLAIKYGNISNDILPKF